VEVILGSVWVELVAWAREAEVVERRVLVGNPHPTRKILISAILFDPDLLESMRRQWQRLPNWKAATVEGLAWEGTAEENARKYTDLVGVSTP
jgi:hypothetical protein